MKKILIIDIETTGFSHTKNSIIEIGIVSLDLDTGDIRVLFDHILHEEKTTPEEVEKSWVIENSGITALMIHHSPKLSHFKEHIQSIIEMYPLGSTAYNNQFDFGFLEDRGFKFPVKLPCPMKLSTDICKIPAKYGKSGYKWPSCEEAYKHFFPDEDYVEQHRGADDAVHEAKIVKELYDLKIFKL
jgi:DNA polymerase III epsilon subunit-like protein